MNFPQMPVSKKTSVIFCLMLIAALIAAAVWFFGLPDQSAAPVSALLSYTETDAGKESLPEFYYSEEELRKMVETIAKEKFGDDAFVLFLSSDGPSKVEIDDVERYVYIYAADSLSAQQESGNVRGLYHADPYTGEIFDNGNGKMEIITIGE